MSAARWSRSKNRYGRVCWTNGVYRIERWEYDLPTRSSAYRVFKHDVRLGCDQDYLVDAKEVAAADHYDVPQAFGRVTP